MKKSKVADTVLLVLVGLLTVAACIVIILIFQAVLENSVTEGAWLLNFL